MIGLNSTVVLPQVFQPSWISGCQVWLRPDLGITVATGVSHWNDQSGNGVNFTQTTPATQPAYNSSGGSNNRAYLTANTGKFLTTPSNVTFFSGNPTVTVTHVAQTTSSSFNGAWGGGASATALGAIGTCYNGASETLSLQFAGGNAANFGNLDTNWHIITTTKTPGAINATSHVQVDNGTIQNPGSGSASTPSISDNPMAVLSWASGSLPLIGGFSEIVVFNRILTANELKQLHNYLGAIYAIAVS